METLYADDHIRVTYDPATKIMFCNWTGHQNMRTIEKACGLILELIRKRSVSKILNDNTQVVGPWHDASEWIHKVWFPEVIAAGLKYFAWVLSKDVFAKLSAHRAMPESVVVKGFDSYEEALGWLQTL